MLFTISKFNFKRNQSRPICHCTIAASVMAVYHANYLKKETSAIVPQNMYHSGNKPYSKSSIEWLEFVAAQTNSVIRHAVSGGGEKEIVDTELGKTYYVDGFCEETNTVYEFYGCVFHSCPLCFDGKNDDPFHSEQKMGDVYDKMIEREKRLQDLGYDVKMIWEHDIRKIKEMDEVQHFLDTFDIVTYLEPRDAFFGGRVNGFKLFREARDDEQLSMSTLHLYPFVNKTKKYPIGHPVIIRENFEDISNYLGFVKCKVLAPSNLYHPVLPVRAKGKLFFPLCKQCVMDDSEECWHSEEERSFCGTFTMIEVMKAIEKGYKFLQIQEVWHFAETSSDLFSEYSMLIFS